MENEKINFEIQKDVLSNDLKIFVKTEIIDEALKELKRTDKSNSEIIKDTIKILEKGFIIPLEKINPGLGILPNLTADLTVPLKAKPINGNKIISPIDIKIDDSIEIRPDSELRDKLVESINTFENNKRGLL